MNCRTRRRFSPVGFEMFDASSTELLTQSSCALPAKGYWFPPTFLTGVTHAHRVASEEIFGPVLSVMIPRLRDTPEEAFERANNIPYGLSAGVWTDKKVFDTSPRPSPRSRRRGRKHSRWSTICAPALCGRTPTTSSIRRAHSAATRKAASVAKADCTGWRRIAGWIEKFL